MEKQNGESLDAARPGQDERAALASENRGPRPAGDGLQVAAPCAAASVLTRERTEEERRRRRIEGDAGAKYSQAKRPAPRGDGCSNTLTSCQKDNLLLLPVKMDTSKGVAYVEPGGAFDSRHMDSAGHRGRVQRRGRISPTLTTASALCAYEGGARAKSIGFSRNEKGEVTGRSIKDQANCLTQFSCSGHTTAQYVIEPDKRITMEKEQKEQQESQEQQQQPQSESRDEGVEYRIRKLTPRECFRLMDVCESDIDKIQAAGISRSQQYKMAGNSIVVACLYHIFDNLFVHRAEPKAESEAVQEPQEKEKAESAQTREYPTLFDFEP